MRGAAAGDFIQRFPAAPAAVLRTVHADAVAVRAGFAFAELFAQAALEIGGDGVLHLLGFVVDLVPLHAENFGEHALDQMWRFDQAVGDFAAFARQRDFAGSR